VVTEAEQPLSVWKSLLIATDSSSYFGVFDRDQLIAIGKAYADPIDVSGKTLGIGAGYVLENYRKRGVITLLFEGIVTWARENKFEHIVCQCRMDNDPIKNFLRKNGFIQTGTEMGRMCTGETVEGFRMERPLEVSGSSPAREIMADKRNGAPSMPSP
jgi:GNAT superfamily N-acetyltransferase